jgi:hypothetical protein
LCDGSADAFWMRGRTSSCCGDVVSNADREPGDDAGRRLSAHLAASVIAGTIVVRNVARPVIQVTVSSAYAPNADLHRPRPKW